MAPARALRPLLLVVLLLCGTTLRAEAPWSWRADELEAIRGLERKVKPRKAWLRLETRHWRIETEADPRFTAELGLFMERFWDVFSELISGESIVPLKPTVVVFASEEAYLKQSQRGTRGNFRYRYDGRGEFVEFHLYTYLGQSGAEFAGFERSILLHEGTHALLQQYLGPTTIPPWFTEGLAEHFETWDLLKDETHNRRACREATSARLRTVAGGESAPPLAEILGQSSAAWNPDEGGPAARRNYAVGAALVDFLLSSAERKRVLVEVFSRLSAGMSPQRVLGPKELRDLEPQWQAHWRLLLDAPGRAPHP